ncbi:uncharacterized protein LOC9655751 [Selaginella moellendorffii]|uniref:uncharacterized protein LOC9655751 n=1 Tax=Selaginella moellendorffii TaxID=88036 RepID=UPI000D1C877C|nr:uncharacterized protein LOC9655751 [Selaginella moellendorffii]|eukprot:XP_024538158.1 uncharacterized protein LOC9655751 [Selaginella moellendorffii]
MQAGVVKCKVFPRLAQASQLLERNAGLASLYKRASGIHTTPAVEVAQPTRISCAMGGPRSMDRPRRRPNFDRPGDTPPTPPPPPPPEPLSGQVKYRISENCVMAIWKGDIALWHVDGQNDCIVAPANKRCNAGFGVDGAIHRGGGPRLLDACQKLPDVAPQGIKCEVGNAVITRGFNLPASRVIHAIGPVYEDKNRDESERNLTNAYKSAIALALKESIRFMAFPALSCELYGYPYDEGAEVALNAVIKNHHGLSEVHFIIKAQDGYDSWIDEAKRMFRHQPQALMQ